MSGFSALQVDADQPTNRHEKSLGLLTTKFVSLLQKAEDGVLDLKVVSCPSAVSFLKFPTYLSLYSILTQLSK